MQQREECGDAVEAPGGKTCVFDRLNAELPSRTNASGLRDHIRRNVDAAGTYAGVAQIPRKDPAAAAEIKYQGPRFHFCQE